MDGQTEGQRERGRERARPRPQANRRLRLASPGSRVCSLISPRDVVEPAQVDPRAVVLRVGVGDPLVAGLGVVKGVGPEGLQDVAVVAEGACCARLICCMRFGGCG